MLSTAAEPSVFPPYEFPDGRVMVDGGVMQMNPAFVGLAEAYKLHHFASNN